MDMTVAAPRPAKDGASAPPRLDTTVVKAMAVLELLARSDTPLGVSGIARELDLQKSNVHRLLGTLSALGYVQKDSALSRYSLTLKVWELGTRVIGRTVVKRVAMPFLRALHGKHDETIYLSVLSGLDLLYLEKIDTLFPLRATMPTGWRVPALFPASGRVLLAHQPDPAPLVAAIIAAAPRAAGMESGAVLKELARIRRDGYATTLSGWHPNINSVAAAVMGRGAPPLAAVGISGPAERMPPARLRALSVDVMHAAHQVFEALHAP